MRIRRRGAVAPDVGRVTEESVATRKAHPERPWPKRPLVVSAHLFVKRVSQWMGEAVDPIPRYIWWRSTINPSTGRSPYG